MQTPKDKEDVIRRVVVEYGQVYAYCYMTDGNGRLLDEEVFKQPFRLDRKEVHGEAQDCYSQLFDLLNESINVQGPPLQGDGDDAAQSG
jgi:hypothetical protein